MAHGDAREGMWRGNWRMEWLAGTFHTTSEHGVSSITTADAHTSADSSRLNWCPLADLNGLVRFAERRNLVSSRVPSHFKRSLHQGNYSEEVSYWEAESSWVFETFSVFRSSPTAYLSNGLFTVHRTSLSLSLDCRYVIKDTPTIARQFWKGDNTDSTVLILVINQLNAQILVL